METTLEDRGRNVAASGASRPTWRSPAIGLSLYRRLPRSGRRRSVCERRHGWPSRTCCCTTLNRGSFRKRYRCLKFSSRPHVGDDRCERRVAAHIAGARREIAKRGSHRRSMGVAALSEECHAHSSLTARSSQEVGQRSAVRVAAGPWGMTRHTGGAAPEVLPQGWGQSAKVS